MANPQNPQNPQGNHDPAGSTQMFRAFVDQPSEHTPASLVRAQSGRTTAILDRAAAAKLEG